MLGLIGGDKTYENDGVQRQRKNPEKSCIVYWKVLVRKMDYIFFY